MDGRYELIDGEIILKRGQKPLHSVSVVLIASWLISLFGRLSVQSHEPIRIPGAAGKYTEPEPDIAVTLLPTTAYMSDHPGPKDVCLIVEVADSTLGFDMKTKALIYSRAGVPEYWVANINERLLHIHRSPTSRGYRSVVNVRSDEMASLESRPEVRVLVSTFFPVPTSSTD